MSRTSAACVEATGSGIVDEWELTARISPRALVRAAAVDDHGNAINVYPLLHPITGQAPLTPWAVPLADRQGRFRLICFDLDAKTSAEESARDATRLTSLLIELGIAHVECASGPTGGRHVWLGLRDPVDADLVNALAQLAKGWLQSLDIAPLVNPVSGCVRPPGAPHRLGGVSRVVSGSVAALIEPAVTLGHVRLLIGRLAADHVERPTPRVRAGRPIATTRGAPFLVGQRRPLSAACRVLLERPPAGDLSALLWRILCGAAAAHWRFTDVTRLVDAPGLEHVRTLRSGATRVPRPRTGSASPMAVLRRQWERAVSAMATAPARQSLGVDATFDARAEVVTAVIRRVQGRADAVPGRWADRRGLSQRRVLDALCLFHVQGVRVDEVEADIRRLSLTCGIDRETVRRSLLVLAADGWIHRTHRAVGRRGARWTVDPAGVIHRSVLVTLSQADPRPADTGPALRRVLLDRLTDRLDANTHDAFAPTGGLGLDAGSLYGRLADLMDAITSSRIMGWPPARVGVVLERLAAVGLVVKIRDQWRRTRAIDLDRAADEQGTTGRTQARAERYASERAIWEAWQSGRARLRVRRHPRVRPSQEPEPSAAGASP